MANKEEGFDGDSERDTLPYLNPTKKWSLYRVKEKPYKKRFIKRHPFSSRLYLDGETGTGDELGISSYIPSKPYYISKPRSTSSHLLGL